MEKKSKLPYFLALLLCAIPMIGAFVGITLIVMGLTKYKDKWFIRIGIFGIVFTVLLYSGLFLLINNTHGFDDLNAKIAQKRINTLVLFLEDYKLQHGQYPASLPQLNKEDTLFDIWTFDPTQESFSKKKIPDFQYLIKGDHYLLFSLGVDGIPHTKDDIYPNLPDSGHYGFLKQ